MTLPTTTELINSGLTFAALSAAFEAISAISIELLSLNLPPYAPNGVLLAPTTNTPKLFKLFKFNNINSQRTTCYLLTTLTSLNE